MQTARNTQREFWNLRLERGAILCNQLVRPAHRPNRRFELATARVLELLSRPQQRLLTNHARPANLLHSRVAVGNDPVPRNQLRSDRAHVLDHDRVSEYVALVLRIGLVGDELWYRVHGKLVLPAFGHNGFATVVM